MPAARRSSSRGAGWLCCLLCIISKDLGSVCQQQDGKVAWLVPAGASKAGLPANATTFATAEDFLTPQHLAVFDTLLLAADYSMIAAEWGQQPYVLQRNLTIASAPGHVFKLEFDFVAQALRVPAGVTVTLRNMAIGKWRVASGWSLPFFAGDGGTIVLLGVVRVRLACMPVSSSFPKSITARPRPVHMPGLQQVGLVDFPWRGSVYPGSVHAANLAFSLGPGDVGDMQAFQGYDMLFINVTRVCLSYVTDCTDTRDVCLTRAVQQILHGPGPDSRSDPSHAAVVALVVPVVAAAVVLAVVAALVVSRCWKRKQQQLLPLLPYKAQQSPQQQQLQADARAEKCSSSGAGRQAQQQQQVLAVVHEQPAVTHSPQQHVLVGGWPVAGGEGMSSSSNWVSGPATEGLGITCSGVTGTIEDIVRGAADGSNGWQLMACHNAPEFSDAAPTDKIALGVLLGVGSFGRVYKGLWRGLAVAVKVLHHDSNTAAAVANEVDLVMSFKHRNITTAFHFVTWNQTDAATNLVPAGCSRLHHSTAAQAAAAVNSSCSADLGKQQTAATQQGSSLLEDAAGGAAGSASGASAAGSAFHSKRHKGAAAAVAALLGVDEQAWSAAACSAGEPQLVTPNAALGHVASADFSSISSVSDCIAARSPAAAAAAVSPAARQPEAAARASWTSAADGQLSSSIGNVRSPGLQPGAAAAADPAAAVSPVADIQQVQLWPVGPFALLTSLELEPSLDQQQQQQQQQFSPLPSQADATSASCSKSMTHTSGGKRPLRYEAQTWLVMEYCDGGTLLDVLQDGRLVSKLTGKIVMAHLLALLCDVAAGMSYLHSRNVLHGDLKPGNVLLKQQQGAPYGHVCKVTDFGMSRCLKAGQSYRSTRTLGTVNHTSPELLRLGRLSPAGDIYAFGILMWELFTGRVAWAGMHYGEVFERVALMQQRPPVPHNMPADYAQLMAAAWSADPFARPSFDVIGQRLAAMLAGLVQAEDSAGECFVFDLV